MGTHTANEPKNHGKLWSKAQINGLKKHLKEGKDDSAIAKLFSRTEQSIFQKKRQLAQALLKKGERLEELARNYRLQYTDICPPLKINKMQIKEDTLSELIKDCESLSLGSNTIALNYPLRKKVLQSLQKSTPPRKIQYSSPKNLDTSRYVAIHYKLQGLKFEQHITRIRTFYNEDSAKAYKMMHLDENILVMKSDD